MLEKVTLNVALCPTISCKLQGCSLAFVLKVWFEILAKKGN